MSTGFTFNRRLRVAACLGAFLAAGCGGGGDGGPAPVPFPAPVAITATNQNQVASATANVFVGLGIGGSVVPLSSGGRTTAAALPGSQVVRKATAVTLAVAKASASDSRVIAQAVIPIDLGIVCTSGSVSATLDDLNSNAQPDLGETITVDFNNCADGSDSVNGRMTVVISSIAGAQINAEVGFSNLRSTTSDGNATLNGGLSIAITAQTSGAFTSTFTVGGSGLTSAVASTSYNDTLTLASGLTMTLAFDPNALPPSGSIPGRTELSIAGTVASSSLAGSFTISTPVAVVQFDADNYPRSGTVISTGANGTKLRLRVQDQTTVLIDLDANGDGTYETTTPKPWSDIL